MSNTPPLEILIEAALFYNGGSMSVKELAGAVGADLTEVEASLDTLSAALSGRGLSLVRDAGKVALTTAKDAHALIQKMRKDELDGPLGKAGLETIAVIIFRGPLSRADIEYVRGVNSTSILRSLLIRGLIERVEHPTDKRSFMYRATPELPAFLGVSSVTELPRYAEMKSEIEAIFAERDRAESEVKTEAGDESIV